MEMAWALTVAAESGPARLTSSGKRLTSKHMNFELFLGEQAGTMTVQPRPYGFLAANLEILEMQLSNLGIEGRIWHVKA